MSVQVETSPLGRMTAKGRCPLKVNGRDAKSNLHCVGDCFHPWRPAQFDPVATLDRQNWSLERCRSGNVNGRRCRRICRVWTARR